mmetsp:Transcript_22699/g.51465  ORF Transcript_22699/g.51465 Transcript_22699/m.51465 type:complete len:115 (-) Transcript_22699:41-385(-)
MKKVCPTTTGASPLAGRADMLLSTSRRPEEFSNIYDRLALKPFPAETVEAKWNGIDPQKQAARSLLPRLDHKREMADGGPHCNTSWHVPLQEDEQICRAVVSSSPALLRCCCGG